jgi:hypothetical protein
MIRMLYRRRSAGVSGIIEIFFLGGVAMFFRKSLGRALGIVNGGCTSFGLLDHQPGAMGLQVKIKFVMILLHQFSWQQFLITALVLAVAWYAVIGLLYFRGEVSGLFSGRKLAGAGQVWQPAFEGPPEVETENLLGRSREPEGVSVLAMDAFSFVGGNQTVNEPSDMEEDDREIQLRLIPDLMEELKTIFYRLERDGGDRLDFEEWFRPVAARFESVITSASYAAVNAYILENVPFELSEKELEAMWEGLDA